MLNMLAKHGPGHADPDFMKVLVAPLVFELWTVDLPSGRGFIGFHRVEHLDDDVRILVRGYFRYDWPME